MIIKPPIFKEDGKIFYKNVPRCRRKGALKYRERDCYGKLLPINEYEDY